MSNWRCFVSQHRRLPHSAKATHRHAEDGLRAARDGESARKKTADTTERELVRLKAEARALTETLSAGIAQGFTPVIDLLQVTPGFEAALGAALGDDLNVPLDENAPIYWRALHGQGELPELPPDVQSLAGKHLGDGSAVSFDPAEEATDMLQRALENFWLVESMLTPAMEAFERRRRAT